MEQVTSPPCRPPRAVGKLVELRDQMLALGFVEAVEEAERLAPQLSVQARRPLVRRVLAGRGDAAGALALALVHGEAVTAEAIGRRLADRLVRLGLLRPTRSGDGRLEGVVVLVPFEGLLITADVGGAGADAVMAPGVTSSRLARLLPGDLTGRRVLDLGTGPGSLALVARRSGATVVATDVNPRCAAFCRFNAALNGLDLDIRTGDLTEPVGDARFDVVVCQPPYVPRPSGVDAVTYLHGGSTGDEVARRVLGVLPELLDRGGEGLVAFHAPGSTEEVAARVASAVTDADVDVALLAAEGPDADAAAIGFGLVRDPQLGTLFDETVGQYHEVLTAHGASSSCLVVVRRRPLSSRTASRASLSVGSLPSDRRPLGAWLAGLDLAEYDDMEVLAASVAVPQGTRLTAERAPGSPTTDLEYVLRFPPGALAVDRGLTEFAAGLLDALCSGVTVGEALAAFAEATNTTPDAVRSVVLGFVRESLGLGVLSPVH